MTLDLLSKCCDRALSLSLAAAAILLIGTAPLLAQDATITEWAIPSPQNAPPNVGQSTLPAGDDTVYFTESVGGKIGKLNMRANRITEWTISQTGNPVIPNDLARGEERIFFTEVQPLLSGSSSPSSSSSCPPGTICPPPTQTPSGGIGELDPESGLVTLWPLTSNSPGFPVFRQGLIYFLEPIDNRVGSLNPATGDLREWELPPPVISGGGTGCISFLQPSCGGCCQSLEDFFSGTPASPQVFIATVLGLDADREGDNLWFSEDVSHRIARLNIPTNTLTEWAIPPTDVFGGFNVQLHEGLVYFTAGGSVMRLDPNTNVISVWNDPTAVSCPPPSPGSSPCLPTTLTGLVVTGRGEDSNDLEASAKIDFSVPGALISTTPSVTVIKPQIGEFFTSDAPHVDYPATPITSVLSPVESQVAATTWTAPESHADLEPTVTQLPAVQSGGFTLWTGSGATFISKLPGGGLAFSDFTGNKIVRFSPDSGDRHRRAADCPRGN